MAEPPLGQKIEFLFQLCFDSLFEAFLARFGCKREPQIPQKSLNLFLVSQFLVWILSRLGVDFGRPGETQTSQKHGKTHGFWRFFKFELFAAWVRFGTTLASKMTLKKLQKTQDTQKAMVLKTSCFLHHFF